MAGRSEGNAEGDRMTLFGAGAHNISHNSIKIDRHDKNISNSYNVTTTYGVAPPKTSSAKGEDAVELPEKWPSDDHDSKNIEVKKVTNPESDMMTVYREMRKGKNKKEVYAMTQNPHGKFVMFSNRKFDNPAEFCDLPCGEQDEEALKSLFGQFGFITVLKKDMTAKTMLEELQKEVEEEDAMGKTKAENYDCFVVAVTSHGDRDVVFGKDGKKVPIEKLKELVDSEPALYGKPKIFLIDACQGGEDGSRSSGTKTASPGTKSERGPIFADTYTAIATIPKCTAGFKERFGSYYMQAIAYVFSRCAYQNELLEMMTKVNQLVSLTEDQMPEPRDSLRKKLYFFPGL